MDIEISNGNLRAQKSIGATGPSTPPESRKAARQRSVKRFSRFISYYRPHLPLFAAILACALLVAVSAIAVPLIANHIVSRLPQLREAPDALAQLLLLGATMLVIFLIQAFATYFVDYRGHAMGAEIEAQVRRDLFAHCQRLSFSFYDRQRTGQLMSRISNDSLWLGELFHHGPEDLAIGGLKFIGATIVMALVDPVIAIAVLLLVPFAGAYALHFNRRMNIALRSGKERIAAINERVEDALAGIRVVQSFATEAEEQRRFELENLRFLESRKHGYRAEAFLWGGMEGFAQLVTAVVIIAAGVRIVFADLSPASLVTLLLCVGVLLDPIKRFDNFIRLWQEGYTGFVRAMELLETDAEITDRPHAVALGKVAGAIGFHDVVFRYETDGPQVLDRVSFDIQPGEFVALVGPSGVGKSTLCGLIPRFYDVLGGSVTIDGKDVRDLTLASLRRSVGVVQQDVYLFSGTVAENLRYGRPDASDTDIMEAAKAAHAHDFITALPRGYETDVGQRGVKLSGGQKQRLTIARAFLKNPPILIFDEATSALDSEAERAVQEGLMGLVRGRTTIVIAHRLSTVRHADRILVLTPEGIAQEGTHESLLRTDGVYARLHELQASI